MKNDYPVLARKLSAVYGYDVRIVGPYMLDRGRKTVNEIRMDGRRVKSCQLARVRLEIKIGRKLRKNETVDHKDDDCTNDSYSNVQVLSRSENAAKSVLRVSARAMCAWCGSKFELSTSQRNTRSKSRAGPFCSRSCSGYYGKSIQLGCAPQGRKPVDMQYYKLSGLGGIGRRNGPRSRRCKA